MNRATTIAALTLAMTLPGCGGSHPAVGAPVAGGLRAAAMLRDATGAPVGRATVSEVAGGLRITVDGHGLPPGLHGAHLHRVGACDVPGFASAGEQQRDLPDLLVGRDGRGTLGVVIEGATMPALLDADGASLVVQAEAGDPMRAATGSRIACGVFAPV